MTRPHPLTAMSEREWSQAWKEQQLVVDRLNSRRGSWLPHVVEQRSWGAVRWTSGRPAHAASSGRAVTETFVVMRPDVHDSATRADIERALRDPAPVMQFAGSVARSHQVVGALVGGVALAVVVAGLLAVMGAGGSVVIIGALVALIAGAVGGAVMAESIAVRERAKLLADTGHVRVITGRYAPKSWLRLVEASTTLEASLPRLEPDGEGPDAQAHLAVHAALWEAAGLLLGSSDHTGVEVLAEGVERLAEAHGR